MTTPALQLENLNKRFGPTRAADAFSLSIAPGEFFTFLGPSGSGKSSILRMIAGLETPDSGRIVIAGKDMTSVPPWKRNLGMVFQHYAIFPHMNVGANIAYGLRLRKKGSTEIEAKVDNLLKLVGLAGMQERAVTRLSGGEQQRVALARSLALEPDLLLLDEPLSALDEKIRREMQTELKRIQHQTQTTFIYVTHDQEEALTMSDRIAVINQGRCVQCDRPEALFQRPRSRFVAEFFRGCNVLEAECLEVLDGVVRLRLGNAEFDVARDDAVASAPVAGQNSAVAIRSERPRIVPASGSTLTATLTDIVYRGTVIDHHLRLSNGQMLTVSATQRQSESVNVEVGLALQAGDLVLLED